MISPHCHISDQNSVQFNSKLTENRMAGAGAGATCDLFSDWDETDNSANPEGIEVKIEVPEDGDYVNDIENSTNPAGGGIEVKTELTEDEDVVDEIENSTDTEGIVVKREVPEDVNSSDPRGGGIEVKSVHECQTAIKQEGVEERDPLDLDLCSDEDIRRYIKSFDAIQIFPCSQCEYKAKQKSDLQKHLQSVHDGQTFPCHYCEYKASRNSNLQAHIKSVHDGRKFPCPHCEYKATRNSSLQRHIKSIHEVIIIVKN